MPQVLTHDLRNAVLQAAIQGRLSTHDENDTPVEETLGQIRNIKKDAVTPSISVQKIPFDIPDNWKWVSCGEVVILQSGADLKPKEYNDKGFGIPYMTGASNIVNNSLLVNRWTEIPKCIAHKGDLLLVCKGSGYGRTVFADVDEFHIARQFMAIKPVFPVNPEYVKIVIDANFDSIRSSNKSLIPGIDRTTLLSLPFPFPPVEEQIRIAARVNELMAKVNEYEALEKRLITLQEAFHNKLKDSILHAGMQGKLTEQKQDDGDAADLIRMIREMKEQLPKEKTTRKKRTLSDISDEEIPYDIPDNWKWARLGSLCTKIVDGAHKLPAGLSEPTEYRMLSALNVNNNRLVDLDKCRYLTAEEFEKENQRTDLQVNDVLLTIIGTLRRSCVYKGGYNLTFQRNVAIIRTLICPEFLKLALDSPAIQQQMYRNSSGTVQKAFYLNRVSEMLIPVPPMKEQQRIVEKLNRLLSLCDALETISKNPHGQ